MPIPKKKRFDWRRSPSGQSRAVNQLCVSISRILEPKWHYGEIVVVCAAVVLKMPQTWRDFGQDRNNNSCSSMEYRSLTASKHSLSSPSLAPNPGKYGHEDVLLADSWTRDFATRLRGTWISRPVFWPWPGWSARSTPVFGIGGTSRAEARFQPSLSGTYQRNRL